ncbi:hypothetical protein LZ554_008948 [Drepanopeziza brunnea f. sp. 'monogermtubi']|nr:hypothetical protein LZ554_008948 [Drepanopeziza brunnea f. sp. 'monogermtubi']
MSPTPRQDGFVKESLSETHLATTFSESSSTKKESVNETRPSYEQKTDASGIILIPQPSDDPADPLNWPLRKKIIIFACICLSGFAGQMSPNSNQLTFMLQVPNYVGRTSTDLLNSVAAGLAGWMAGPFIITPLAGAIGRPAVVLYSLIGTFACQIWAANMDGPNDFIPFLLSRLICGMFGVIPAIMGVGFIMDMFFLHQRGKAFALFEVLIIFAVVGGGTLGGFIAETNPWTYVFWWTLGPIGAAIISVFLFVEDTTFDRTPGAIQRQLPTGYLANRLATFFIGTRTQPSGKKLSTVKFRAISPIKIVFTPVTIMVGMYVFVALGLPIMQASTLAVYMMPPEVAGGYGLSSLRLAFFTMTAWLGMFAAQLYGYLFNDMIPLYFAKRKGGAWHPEYRLSNVILPGIILPIGLGIWGAGIEYHLDIMVLAFASFLIWFSALLILPICYNYIVECFIENPVEAAVALNGYRISFGIMSVFVSTRWDEAVGAGWMWGMGAFFVVFVNIVMLVVIFKGHVVRQWSVSKSISATEDGERIVSSPAYGA